MTEAGVAGSKQYPGALTHFLSLRQWRGQPCLLPTLGRNLTLCAFRAADQRKGGPSSSRAWTWRLGVAVAARNDPLSRYNITTDCHTHLRPYPRGGHTMPPSPGETLAPLMVPLDTEQQISGPGGGSASRMGITSPWGPSGGRIWPATRRVPN